MIAVPILYRRAQRGLFVQKLQHALPSIVVLGDGLNHLSHDPHGIDLGLGIAEVGVSLLVIGSVIRGFRQLLRETAAGVDTSHAHHGPDWIDVSLGVMLAVEAYAKFHATGHVPRPTILLSVVMLTIGMLHGRIAGLGTRRRQLRVTPDGISLPGKFFSRLTLTWADIASIEIEDRSAIVTALDGRMKKIDLNDVLNATAVRDALISARTQLDEARLAAAALHAPDASIESDPSNT